MDVDTSWTSQPYTNVSTVKSEFPAETPVGGAFHQLADAAHRLAAATDGLLIAQKIYAQASEDFALLMQTIDKESEGQRGIRVPWATSVPEKRP